MNLIQKILYESKLDDQDEFDLNPIFQPNPNQIQRYKQELERRKKVIRKIKLGLEKINKAYENKQWESEEEKLFLKSFYKSKVKLYLEEYPNEIFIIKNGKVIAYQDLKNKLFGIDYESIWEVFEDEFHWSYYETQSFMKTMLNKYFQLKDYIPMKYYIPSP